MTDVPKAIIESTRLIAAIARVTHDIGVAEELAQDALAILAVGTCASFGGIPAGAPQTGMPLPGSGFGKDGGKVVWVKDEKGGIRPNPIKTGIDNGTNIEVVSGLKEGDEVVISMSGDGSTTTKKTQSGPRGPFPF